MEAVGVNIQNNYEQEMLENQLKQSQYIKQIRFPLGMEDKYGKPSDANSKTVKWNLSRNPV